MSVQTKNLYGRTTVLPYFLAVCVLSWPRTTPAQSSFAGGSAAYEAGDYRRAIAHYEALLGAGLVHEHIYYNVGNAYFRIGEFGRAIYNYERALLVSPSFDDARHNLTIARRMARARSRYGLFAVENDPVWVRMITFFSSAELAWAFLLSNWLFFALLFARRTRTPELPRLSFFLRVSVVFVGLVFALSAFLLLGQTAYYEAAEIGIVLPGEVTMYEGTDQKTAERTRLEGGLRVRVIASEPGWLKVRLGDGSEGWVPDEVIGRLR